MKQVDGIFGSERTGGYNAFKWMPQAARSARENIRTWDQLGLAGDCANKPINTYGYAPTGMRSFFEIDVFNGGDKWNPNYREFVEAGTKMVSGGEVGQSGSIDQMLVELAKDKYGIGWTGIGEARTVTQVKPVALAAKDGAPTLNLRGRTFKTGPIH